MKVIYKIIVWPITKIYVTVNVIIHEILQYNYKLKKKNNY